MDVSDPFPTGICKTCGTLAVVNEEESIYFNDNYGIVAIRGDVWGYFLEFNKGGQFEAELFKLLKKDTSGFYSFKIPPLPKIE